MHLAPLIHDLAVILSVAGVVTLLFKKIKQPVVLGYLVAGVIIGPYTPPFPLITDLPNIQVWAELGVIFLMFSLGLEFTFHKLVRVGGTASGTALVEVLGMVGIGYAAGQFLGWGRTDSIFLGGILSISSTTIIIKAFESLNLKTRRFAELVFGVLIVEDLVAILLLVALSTVAVSQSLFTPELLVAGFKLILVVGVWFLVGYFFIPSFLKRAGNYADNETLTVIATGLCLFLVVIAARFQYSPALGAFIMGSILAETSESHRIEKLIQPLRDLFAAVFFVSVGMLMNPQAIWDHRGAVLLITVLTIVGKILTSTAGALASGQPLKRSVQIGFSLAQIGEFSFIIATLGATLKVTSDFIFPLAVAVSVITTFTTPYLIRVSEPCASFLEKHAPTRFKNFLFRYSQWMQEPRAHHAAGKGFARSTFRFLLNGIIVTGIFLEIDAHLVPKLQEHFPREIVLHLISWTIGITLSAPFVWGMFYAYHPPKSAKKRTVVSQGFSFFLGQLGTILWLGFLSQRFFSTTVSLLVTLIAAGTVFALFYRRLEVSYRWFEKRFLSNLRKEDSASAESHITSVLPWDLHLVKVHVHPDSAMVGHTLLEADVRNRYGITILAISRGTRTIPSPTATDRLLPLDELLVLATDEQIETFRTDLDAAPDKSRDLRELTDYSLKRILVADDSPFVGKPIRTAGIRETHGGLVVGMERKNQRTINPDPSLPLQAGDQLWVVGGLS